MVAPAFDFTDRAAPVVQFGRSEKREVGNDRWSRSRWGVGKWGMGDDWEPAWVDLTCELHEITTNTGRGGATDRFVPGTAYITASNVKQISEMIFPPVPGYAWESTPVPQPPIDHEESLQAPNAATISSNGWSFTDDFETRPPHWVFPSAWATTGTVPYGPFKLIDGAWEPELYDLSSGAWSGNAAAQWGRNYDPADNSSIEIVLDLPLWPSTPTAGTPQVDVDLMLRGNTSDKECDCARFTFTPNFSGANSIAVRMFHMSATGTVTAGSSTTTFTTGTGTSGTFGTRTLSALVTFDGQFRVSISGVVTDLSWTLDSMLTGTRIGIGSHYEQGTLGTAATPPRITSIAGPDFVDTLDRRLGSGWVLPDGFRDSGHVFMYQDGGAMRAPARFLESAGGEYFAAKGMAQWTSEFDGDQMLDVQVAGMSMPRPTGHVNAGTWLEMYTHGNRHDLSCMAVYVNWDPAWGTSHSTIYWSVWQYGPHGEIDDYAPSVSGAIDVGATNGVFPEPERWRVESDLSGEQRIYRNGTLLGTANATAPPTGGRIGVRLDWRADNLIPNGNRRPAGASITQLSGGLQEPLGTEDLGTWIRIGVDHAELGRVWFFRGFVDALVPTYVPERQDAVRIECIDSLGEAGRVFVDGGMLTWRFANGQERIRQILTAAHWPKALRHLEDDANLLSRPPAGKAVDLLTQVAESVGGAVYGDPQTGDVVFKGQDWQGYAAGQQAEAWITNYRPDLDDGTPRVCPAGWERSSRRSDMTTRARFSSVTSDTEDGRPIVKEWAATKAERLYGVELYERTLLAIVPNQLTQLARRQIRLRHPNQFPRIEAVLLDASTADEALDLMTSASFTAPSKYGCQHMENGRMVFNRRMIVTGVRHTMSPKRWTCRLALDPASVFAETGSRWGRGLWGRGSWGRTR